MKKMRTLILSVLVVLTLFLALNFTNTTILGGIDKIPLPFDPEATNYVIWLK
ncbi:MAG: hypothetical protein GX490_00860 [Bacilli bacterium]|nr:hypothetical protein [Bacilli bacterium]